MPVTRSQAAAAALRRGSPRDLGQRRGVLTRRQRELAAAAPEASKDNHAAAAAAAAGPDEPRREENTAGNAAVGGARKAAAAGGARGKRRAVEEVGPGRPGSGGGANDSSLVIWELQTRVRDLEAEVERMKEERERTGASDDPEAATAESRAVAPGGAGGPDAAAGTHVSSLGDALLLEVLLRLPSLATLVRAACACRSWRRAVASSRAFRRCFRALHPPPLLGVFSGPPGPAVPAFPAFVPARSRDRDLAAAVRGGDFFLTSLQYRAEDEEAPRWEFLDCCRRGYVLVADWDAGLLAVINPLARRSQRVFHLVSREFLDRYGGFHTTALLLWSDEDSLSFRVVLVRRDGSRTQAAVFSSDTEAWSVTPWPDVPARTSRELPRDNGVKANGSVHWVSRDRRSMVSLDTAAMEFSISELPIRLMSRNFGVGETKDGATCIVYSDGFDIGVLRHTRDNADGAERWVPDRVVPMDAQLDRVLPDRFGYIRELDVMVVRDGYAYLATSAKNQDRPQKPCWVLSLCLETMELEKMFPRTFDRNVHPYIMAWPRLLGRNDQ